MPFFGPFIYVNPTSAPCGDLTVGSPIDFSITIGNTGDDDLIVDGVAAGGDISFPGLVVPFTVTPGNSTNVVVRVTPSGVGAGDEIVTVTSNAVNNPVTMEVTWTGVAAGTKALTVDPPAYVFPDTKAGEDSAEVLFTITNVGTVNVTIASITPGADFTLSTDPGMPLITPGDSVVMGLKFSPIAAGYVDETCDVASDAAASPFTVATAGMGVLINPAYVITGGNKSLYIPFATDANIVSVKIPPNPITWDSESAAVFNNSLLLPIPVEQGSIPGFSYNKLVTRIFFHYEDFGVASVRWTVTTMDGQTSAQTVAVGTVVANEKVLLGIADINITDEVIEIQLEVLSGQFFLVDYVPKYVLKGEKVK